MNDISQSVNDVCDKSYLPAHLKKKMVFETMKAQHSFSHQRKKEGGKPLSLPDQPSRKRRPEERKLPQPVEMLFVPRHGGRREVRTGKGRRDNGDGNEQTVVGSCGEEKEGRKGQKIPENEAAWQKTLAWHARRSSGIWRKESLREEGFLSGGVVVSGRDGSGDSGGVSGRRGVVVRRREAWWRWRASGLSQENSHAFTSAAGRLTSELFLRQ